MEEYEFPIKTNSAELFYTSHTIEHITDSAVSNIFLEAYRSLKPNGIFRIVCPDADLLYFTLKFSRLEYWHWRYNAFKKYTETIKDLSIEDFLVKELATERSRFFNPNSAIILYPKVVRQKFFQLDKVSFLNFLVEKCSYSEQRANWHINWWNEEKIKFFLQKVGFSKIITSGYGKSLAAPFHNTKKFDSRCPTISLYVEAIK